MTRSAWLTLTLIACWLPSLFIGSIRSNDISGDGIYYTAYVRSLLIDHDLDFRNELERFADNPHVARQLDSGVVTPTGLTPNLFSIGPAIVWAPLYILAHIFVGGDGYSQLEIISFSISTALLALLGLWFAWKALQRIFPKHKTSFVLLSAIMAVFYGTNLFYYSTFETTMSHAAGFAAVSALIFFWARWRPRFKTWQWGVLGILSGGAGLMRWQILAVGAVIILAELIAQKKWYCWKAILLAVAGGVIGFGPQLLIWKILYGSWLVIPQGTGFLDVTSPHALEVLVSARHGLLTWTPLVLVALIGLVHLIAKKSQARFVALVLCLVFIVQVYINGTAIEWWGGDAFGARRFADISQIFMIGLGSVLLVARQKKVVTLLASTVLTLLISANILLMQAYRHGYVPRAAPFTYAQMSKAIASYLIK